MSKFILQITMMKIAQMFTLTLALACLLCNCSKFNTPSTDTSKSNPANLGPIEMVDGSPTTFDLGAGKTCTITPQIGFGAVVSYELLLNDNTTLVSAPTVTAPIGQAVRISVGQTQVDFLPDVQLNR